MKEVSERMWADFSGRFRNCHCHFCHEQAFDFDNPHFGAVAGVDTVAVSCRNCGHVELFDVDRVRRKAEEIDADLRKKGWR